MAAQFLTAAERWSLVEQAHNARWRVWGRDGAHIPMVVAIQFDQRDNELLVDMLAAWDRFTGSLWLADPGAIADEWVRLTYYHSAWFGRCARRVPADARAQWVAELDPFRAVATDALTAVLRGARAVSKEARMEGLGWANSALSHRRHLAAGNGFRLWLGDFRKYLTQDEIKLEQLEDDVRLYRSIGQMMVLENATLVGKPH